MSLQILLKKIQVHHDKADLDLIRKASRWSEKYHKGQKRASGVSYYRHPLAVAKILADLRLGPITIASALLHDLVEDTDVTLKDIRKEFGDEIGNIIEGLTKIDKLSVKDRTEYHAESIRKVMLASVQDIRVIFIKLADKLHNMRTVDVFRPEKRKRIAKEVLEIYAPIAYKLGIATIKWELEDLAFRQIEPEIYEELAFKIKKTSKQREKDLQHISEIVKELLEQNGIQVKVCGRPKHIYSIYKKMLRKNCRFSEIYDLTALRIITKSVKDCYTIVGLLHNKWRPVPKEFDDYIAMPKPNMYQSLHTVVIIPDGIPVEIQIRTTEMDRVAEEGIAAHWRYKGVHGDEDFDTKLSWMRQILDWQRESKDAKEFMEMLHMDFFEDEIFSFTPQGDVVSLPKGACVIDFAYSIHTNVGDTAMGGKVNGKFVPLRTVLKNGDMVEVVTAKNQKPSREWLKFAKSSKAKTKIRQSVEHYGKIPARALQKVKEEKKELAKWIIKVEGIRDPNINISKCCLPLPGDKIVGYATASDKVAIHKFDCKNINKVSRGSRKKPVKVIWIDRIGSEVKLKVDAVNRVGLFAEILNTLVAKKTKIKSANAKLITGNIVECSINIEIESLGHLQDLIRRINKIKDVKKVFIGNLIEK
ncbi:MAG: bifunctional (p)ppGpp synthetase/guanosine-3',5'-bis(diphosphate) 3'-pyrophosphohydrolase [archaeon]